MEASKLRALIVVDMQNDFCTGALRSKDAEAIIPKINEFAKKFRSEEHSYVLFTRDSHMPNYPQTQEGKLLPTEHCIVNSHGWQIVDGIEQGPYDSLINKPTFGFKDWQAVFAQLYNIDKSLDEKNAVRPNDYFGTEAEIHIAGTRTDICVIANALIIKTVLPEAKVIVHKSLCSGTDTASNEAALAVLKSCQCEIED